jgi:hypothetical protein
VSIPRAAPPPRPQSSTILTVACAPVAVFVTARHRPHAASPLGPAGPQNAVHQTARCTPRTSPSRRSRAAPTPTARTTMPVARSAAPWQWRPMHVRTCCWLAPPLLAFSWLTKCDGCFETVKLVWCVYIGDLVGVQDALEWKQNVLRITMLIVWCCILII